MTRHAPLRPLRLPATQGQVERAGVEGEPLWERELQ